MYSINADKAGRAAYNAGETEDTVYIKHLMYHLNDPRVTYSYKHYGMRISTIKISALYTIHDIEYEPSDRYKIDTIALQYWINKYPHYYIPYQY